MRRCFSLARRGTCAVKTNPRVGCIIVHDGEIIGEGYHEVYGEAHAEINALRSIAPDKKVLLPHSTLYVSLEPCHHTGKTPPCVDAIIAHDIKRVVISTMDPNPQTYGKSIQKLRDRDIQVVTDILPKLGKEVIKEFDVHQSSKRPFIVLKWAQSRDGYMSKKGEQTWLSNDLSQRMVHRWRSEIDAILVGTDTAIIDNPQLTNRRGFDRSPMRILLDRKGRVPTERYLLSDEEKTIVFTCQKDYASKSKEVIHISENSWSWESIFEVLLKMKIGSVMVEGGKKVLHSLIKEELWDEARIIHAPIKISSGIKAPSISGQLKKSFGLRDDRINIVRKKVRD